MNRPDFSVADLGELVTLSVSDAVEGANVWVDADGAYWTLEKNSGVAPSPTVLAPLPGAPSAGASNARWIRAAGGGGGGPTGDPNTIAFFNPTGGAITDDVKLVAAPVDQFGRPQIRDWRNGANVSPDDGPVYRQGAWETDGDPTNQNSQGIVLYGLNALGIGPSALGGGYARIKPRRIGLAQIIPAVNNNGLFYPFRADMEPTGVNGISLLDDSAGQQFHVDRVTGTVIIGSPVTSGPTLPSGGLFINQVGPIASGSPVGMSQLTKNSAINLRQYGAGSFTSNIGFFRSRGTVIGPLGTPGAYVSVAIGDSLMNLTAQAVTANNIDIPLAAIFDAVVPATGLFLKSVSPNFRWALARDTINDHRVVWTMEGMTGDLIMGAYAPLATQGARIKIDETSRNAMQGVVTLDAAGLFAVANTLITANTRIQLNWQDGGLNPNPPAGVLYPSARAPGVKFTIASTGGAADAGINVFWQLWEPAP